MIKKAGEQPALPLPYLSERHVLGACHVPSLGATKPQKSALGQEHLCGLTTSCFGFYDLL
jgi:hypothetical protein